MRSNYVWVIGLCLIATNAHAAEEVVEPPNVRHVNPSEGLVPSNVLLLIRPGGGLEAHQIAMTIDGVLSSAAFAGALCSVETLDPCMFRARLDLDAGTHEVILVDPTFERTFTLESSGEDDNTAPTAPVPEIEEGDFERTSSLFGGFLSKSVRLDGVLSEDEYGIAAYAIYEVTADGRRLIYPYFTSEFDDGELWFEVYATGEGQVEYQLTAIDLAGNESEPTSFFVETSAEGGCSAAHAARDSGVPFALFALAVPLVLFSRRRRNAFKDGR